MKSCREIVDLYETRRKRLSPIQAQARRIREVYNGDLIAPLPELDRSEAPVVANLLTQGVDQYGGRIASTMPQTRSVSVSGKKGAAERARKRTSLFAAWHDHNRLHLKMQKRARHFVAYAQSPVVVRPDFNDSQPCWHVRDPLCAYPAECPDDELVPPDTIFAYPRSLAWLRSYHPDAYLALNKGARPHPDDTYICLEWIDAEEIVVCVIGQKYAHEPHHTVEGEAVELWRVPNRAERPLAVIPQRLSLGAPRGQFDGVIGLFDWWGKLMSLEVIGMQRSIFPETWLVATTQGVAPRIIRRADSMAGIEGILQDGNITTFSPDPSVLSLNIIDRLERLIRLEGGVPPELGGESSSNIRTGRRGDAVLSAAIDFPIQAAHQMFEASIEEENRIAVAVDKAYFNRTKATFISLTQGEIEYRPSDLWETDRNVTRYSQAGVDASTLVVNAGQRVGLGMMSIETAQELDPLIRDPEQERDRIAAEAANRVALEVLQQRIAQEPGFMPVAVRILNRMARESTPLIEIMAEVDEQLRQEQLAAQEGEADPLAAQPGLAEPQPTIQETEPSLENLTGLLMTLRNGQMAGAVQ